MSRVSKWLRRAGGCLVVVAALGAGLVAFVPQGGAAARSPLARIPTFEAPPALSSAAAAQAILDALPTPEAPPSDPYAPVGVVGVFEMAIPKIGLDRTVSEGVWLTVIDRGPAHWPGTAEPGGWGNVVIAAHRTTHGGPFLRIGDLVAGDRIALRDEGETFVYVVTGSEVVTPDALRIVEQHPGHALTLFACHPIGASTHRLVVHAEMLQDA